MILKDDIQRSDMYFQLLQNEISILLDYQHDNIVKVFDIIEDEFHYSIITETLAGGNLMERMASNGPFKEDQACKII